MAKKDDTYWLGFDLGGSKMLAKVYTQKLKDLGKERKRTRGQDGAEAGVKRMIKTIYDALEDADVSADQLSGIGMGIPGPLDLDKGIILEAPNLGWENVKIQAQMESEFQCPVVILNDVDAGVYGEYVAGAAKKSRCVIGAFIGTGIGGGCVYNGRLIQGKKESCMEIGHFPVLPDGPLCGCGRRGCLEAVASRLAISAAAATAAFRGDAPYLLENHGTDIKNIKSGALTASVEAGDEGTIEILTRAAHYIGRTLAGTINLLSPDTVVLGGGLIEANPKGFIRAIENAIHDSVMPSFQGTYTVTPAEIGDDAGAVGAAAWAIANLDASS